MRRNKIFFLLFVVTAFLLGCGSSKKLGSDSNMELATNDIDEMPEFPGGLEMLMEYLAQNCHYPDAAVQAGIEGRVMVHFIVETDGSITDCTVFESLSKECDEEALRVVKGMPKWKPGLKDGQPVSVNFILPVRFKFREKPEILRPGGRGEY